MVPKWQQQAAYIKYQIPYYGKILSIDSVRLLKWIIATLKDIIFASSFYHVPIIQFSRFSAIRTEK